MIFDPTRSYPKQTDSRVIIRFQDCDPLRHLNNAKYFDYFFNAREDQVAKLYDVRPADFYKEHKATWVIYNHQIAYIRPAMMGSWVRIFSRLLWFNHNTIVVEFYMTDERRTELKAMLWSTMRFVDVAKGTSIDHFAAVQQYLQAVCVDDCDFEHTDFAARIKQLKAEIRGTVPKP